MLIKLNDRSYISGSMHMSKSSMYPLPGKIYRATEECTCIAVELDPSIRPSENCIKRLREAEKTFAEKNREAIERFFKKIGFEYDCKNIQMSFVTYKWKMFNKAGLKTKLGTELHLVPFFDCVIGLETHEYQAEMFAKAIERKMDSASFEPPKNIDGLFDEIIFSIKSGRYDEMMENAEIRRILQDSVSSEIFLTERNEGMATLIEHLEEEGERPFVHVGAAHIGGEDGIVNILRKRGHKLEKV